MKRLFFSLMLCLGVLTMWAVPAKRITMKVQQPDGTVLTLTQRGDEFFHYLMTEDDVMVKSNGEGYYYVNVVDGELVATERLAHSSADRSADETRFVEALPDRQQLCKVAMQRESIAQRARAARAPQKVAQVPSVGEVNIPLLLVQYSDVKFSSGDPKAAFEGHVNGDDYTAEGGYGSVKEFFEDQSEGKFTPRFDIIGPVTLDREMKFYGGNDPEGNDKNARQMVIDACRKADDQFDMDFSKYDNDGDGYVDVLYVLYAGYGESNNASKLEDTIWPHQWQLASPMIFDGVKVSKYACNNELDGYEGTTLDGIGVFCHEFSHCLGLPDFYPTDGSNGFGMESWSLMHYGNYNNNSRTPSGYTGYELDFLGWRELIVINSPQDVTLNAISEGGSAYKIVNDLNPNEYYVVENRQRTKWDQYAPAEGMLVIHVDYKASAWQNNSVNNTPEHQRMTVIPADNKLTKASQSGDTYPGTSGNTALTSESKPAATVYQGEYMGKDITDISVNNGVVTFSFMKGELEVPVQQEVTDVTGDGFTMHWSHVPGIKEYEVRLDILEESPYMLEEDFERVKATSSDIGTHLDSYTIQPGWQGINVYGLDGAIRIGSSSQTGAMISPYLHADSTCFTVLYTVRKSASSDKNAGMVMCVADDEWISKEGYNELYGYGLTITNDEWMTYFVVLDTIGNSSFLYMDTRDLGESANGYSSRVDIDALYLLEGDRTEELLGGNAPAKVAMAKRQSAPMPVAEGVDLSAVIARSSAVKTRAGNSKESEKRYSATTVYTALTTELSHRIDDLDGGLYRCSVRSVRDSIYSRYSNAVEVQIVDSMLPQTAATFDIYIDKDSVYMVADSANVSLFYTTDGSTPTSYSNRYEGPFALSEKGIINAIAREPGHRRSEVVGKRNWFEAKGATYRISSELSPQVLISEAFGGNVVGDYPGHYVVADEVEYDSLVYAVVGIDDGAFHNAVSLRSIQIAGSQLRTIGSNLFHGCTALNAVMWDVEQPLTADMFDDNSYNNLLVYVPAAMTFAHPLIDAGRMVLVEDGVSGALKLVDRYSFYCPRDFKAESVTYSRSFTQSTGLGSSAGWETIALPFDVQQVSHPTKGTLAPFGTASDANFWLAAPSANGFVQASEIQANKPYIIAMPNHKEYGDYSLSGQITFAAENCTIHATDEELAVEGNGYMMVPTYEPIAANDSIYALNVNNKYNTYAAGSVFVPGMYSLATFTAYLSVAGGKQAAPYYRIQAAPDVEEEVAPTLGVTVKEGVVYVTLTKAREVIVYDAFGRKICAVQCAEGVNAITSLDAGIYVIERTKVCVER